MKAPLRRETTIAIIFPQLFDLSLRADGLHLTHAAAEAVHLMMRYVFELVYRRYE